jgi:hypothetical protein
MAAENHPIGRLFRLMAHLKGRARGPAQRNAISPIKISGKLAKGHL